MPPYWSDKDCSLHLGDCREVLAGLPEASVDSIVTDPPYEYAFMGRQWDSTGVAFDVATWEACLRVLKPGGHLLAFGAPRTCHRMTVAIEDAGFEIRDSIGYASGVIAWCYGSGFPKSRNVSKDPAFCQCLPPVRGDAAEDAAESAARLLLADLRRNGQAVGTDIADLHGVPVDLHPGYAIPSRSQQDVQSGLRGDSDVTKQEGSALGQRPASEGCLCPVRDDRDEVSKQGEAQRSDLLLDQLSSKGERGATAGECVRRDGHQAHASLRGGQPSLEGRGDLQAPEGQLHRTSVCALPAGSPGNGSIGRLHHGASAGDGPLGWSSIAAIRGGQPQGQEPSQQCAGEPGAVSVQCGSQARRGWPLCSGCGKPVIPAGLGTALKPAWEPIVLARRPLGGTVAANVLEYGTGALNIDACRVPHDEPAGKPSVGQGGARSGGIMGERPAGVRVRETDAASTAGRWPANIVFTHHAACIEGGLCEPDCPVAELDRQSGTTTSRASAGRNGVDQAGATWGLRRVRDEVRGHSDQGGASRFFPTFRYEAKAPSSERPKLDDGTAHATVKPLDLMRWLVRLVTPPGGVVLDPFAGSGTTLEACLVEGFRCIGVELDEAHMKLIQARIAKDLQPVLVFDE